MKLIILVWSVVFLGGKLHAEEGRSLASARSGLTVINPVGSELKTNLYTLDLGEVNGAGIGAIFHGPIKVSRVSGGMCTVNEDVALVVQPIGVVRDNFFYISTFSGSLQRMFVVDARTCAVRWTSVQFYGTGPVFRRNSIQLNDAGTFRIGRDGVPVR